MRILPLNFFTDSKLLHKKIWWQYVYPELIKLVLLLCAKLFMIKQLLYWVLICLYWLSYLKIWKDVVTLCHNMCNNMILINNNKVSVSCHCILRLNDHFLCNIYYIFLSICVSIICILLYCTTFSVFFIFFGLCCLDILLGSQ